MTFLRFKPCGSKIMSVFLYDLQFFKFVVVQFLLIFVILR